MEELERAEQERLRAEARRIAEEKERARQAAEAEAKKRAEEEFRRKEAEAIERQKVATEQARAETERRKWGREETGEVGVTVGLSFEENGVFWAVQDGRVCLSCAKGGLKCHWRQQKGPGSRKATSCHNCAYLKKSCSMVEKEGPPEAGPLKKQKVEGKGKGKVKVGIAESGGSEIGTKDVWEAILLELKGLRADFRDFRAEYHKSAEASINSANRLKVIARNVSEIADHVIPEQEQPEEEAEEAEEVGNSAGNVEDSRMSE
jgi:hypothetical protein